MRSFRSLTAFLFAAASLGGCDPVNKPAVSTPPGSTQPTTSVASPATAAPPEPTMTPTASAAPTAPPPAPASSTQSSPAEAQWLGSWASPSCGGRTFERRLTLKQDKTFSGQDLVSPCPPKVVCVWSGIIFWSGTWALDDKGALLTKTSGGKDPTKKSNTDVPLRLVWDKAASAPAEISESGAPCVYAKPKDDSTKP